MTPGYEKGTKVEWDWGNGTGSGTIETVYTKKITRTIAGHEITRKASEDDPAYYIKQDDDEGGGKGGGGAVLKGHSEVRKAG